MPDLDDVISGKPLDVGFMPDKAPQTGAALIKTASGDQPAAAPGFLDRAREVAGDAQTSVVNAVRSAGRAVGGETGADLSLWVVLALVAGLLGWLFWPKGKRPTWARKSSSHSAAASGGGSKLRRRGR